MERWIVSAIDSKPLEEIIHWFLSCSLKIQVINDLTSWYKVINDLIKMIVFHWKSIFSSQVIVYFIILASTVATIGLSFLLYSQGRRVWCLNLFKACNNFGCLLLLLLNYSLSKSLVFECGFWLSDQRFFLLWRINRIIDSSDRCTTVFRQV